jgi:beta-glucanase (GH16 family)
MNIANRAFHDLRITPRLCAGAFVVALLSGWCAQPADAQVSKLTLPKNYQLVWSDEFDVDGLPNPAKWDHDTARNKQGWYNNELQYYSGPRAENAVVRDGKLIITARLESMSHLADWGGQRYTSARLLTRGRSDWTYGFVEVRAKLPCGKGTWPAIWTLGSKGRWPDDGELDIMEHVGSDPERVTSAVHTATGHGGQAVWGAARVPDACGEFNRYQMLWTATEVVFGVNGAAHLRYPKLDSGVRAWPFNAPQYLLLNIAIGGDLGGAVDDRIFPVAMEIDYVRVYQAQDPAPVPQRIVH